MDTPACVEEVFNKSWAGFHPQRTYSRELWMVTASKKRIHTALSGTPQQQSLLWTLQGNTARGACLQSFAMEKITMASRKADWTGSCHISTFWNTTNCHLHLLGALNLLFIRAAKYRTTIFLLEEKPLVSCCTQLISVWEIMNDRLRCCLIVLFIKTSPQWLLEDNSISRRLIKSGESKKLPLLSFHTMSNSFCLGEEEGNARDTVML